MRKLLILITSLFLVLGLSTSANAARWCRWHNCNRGGYVVVYHRYYAEPRYHRYCRYYRVSPHRVVRECFHPYGW